MISRRHGQGDRCGVRVAEEKGTAKACQIARHGQVIQAEALAHKHRECLVVEEQIKADQLEEIELHCVDFLDAEQVVAHLAPRAVGERLVVEELAREHETDKEQAMGRVVVADGTRGKPRLASLDVDQCDHDHDDRGLAAMDHRLHKRVQLGCLGVPVEAWLVWQHVAHHIHDEVNHFLVAGLRAVLGRHGRLDCGRGRDRRGVAVVVVGRGGRGGGRRGGRGHGGGHRLGGDCGRGGSGSLSWSGNDSWSSGSD